MTAPSAAGDALTGGPGRARGQDHGRAKLEDHEVIEIRDLALRLTPGVIARRYGLARSTVQAIITRRTWRHLA